MGARRARPARAGRPRFVRRARVRADHGGGDRQAGGAHGADVLPVLRRQARGPVLGRGRTAGVHRGGRGQRACFRRADRRGRCGPGGRWCPVQGAPRRCPAAPGRYCRERRAARARADQARITRLGPRCRAAPARCPRASREPGGRGRDRCLQDRVRPLDRPEQPARLGAGHPGVARRAESRDRGQIKEHRIRRVNAGRIPGERFSPGPGYRRRLWSFS